MKGFLIQNLGQISRVPEQPRWLYAIIALQQHSPLPRRYIIQLDLNDCIRELVFPSWHQLLTNKIIPCSYLLYKWIAHRSQFDNKLMGHLSISKVPAIARPRFQHKKQQQKMIWGIFNKAYCLFWWAWGRLIGTNLIGKYCLNRSPKCSIQILNNAHNF